MWHAVGANNFSTMYLLEEIITPKRDICVIYTYITIPQCFLWWSVTITGELNRQSIMDSHQGVPGSIISCCRQLTHKPAWVDVKNIVMSERDKMRYTTIYTTLIIYE